MPAYTTEDIRNVAIVRNSGVGKTTLIQRLNNAFLKSVSNRINRCCSV